MPDQNPTFAEIMTSWREHLAYLEERELHGLDVQALYDGALVATGGVFMQGALNTLVDDQRAAGTILTPFQVRSIIEPHLLEYLRLKNLPRGGTFEQRWFRACEQLDADGETFLTRNMTYGAATFVGTGTGALRRLSVDRFGNTLESGTSETKKIRCTRDQASGALRHREVFRVEGDTPGISDLVWEGSGSLGTIETVDCLSEPQLVRNPSFESGAGGTDGAVLTSTTQITGWVASAAASFQVALEAESASPHVKVYKGYAGGPVGAGLLAGIRFVANGAFTQYFIRETPGLSFDRDRPYERRIAVKRESGATGNITLRVGSRTKTVAISTLVDEAWNLLRLDLDSTAWFDNWFIDDPRLEITVDSLAVGTVVIDDATVKPLRVMDGLYWLLDGGPTPFLFDDEFTIVDEEDPSIRPRFSYWGWRAFRNAASVEAAGGVWLPTSLTPTVADS